MTKKIFSYCFLVGAVALLLCSGLFFGLQYRQILDDALDKLRGEANFVAQGIRQSGASYLDNLQSSVRVTWMDPAGTVRYDSQTTQSALQQDREEVQQAIQNGTGEAIRRSEIDGSTHLYFALRLEDKSIVRLSMPIHAGQEALDSLSPLLWVFVLVLTLAGLLSSRAAKQIVQPINELNLDHPEQSEVYFELSPLVSRLQELRLANDEQLEALHRGQKEFTALTDCMSEGFLLVDKGGKVLSANACARQLLPELNCEETVLTDPQARSAADKALHGEHWESDLQKNGRNWQLIASPVRSRGVIVGAVLLWMDVTERTQRERLRQEFSANVSHELKTPLTSISGFAELIAQGSVPPDKVREFSADIHREAQRMIALIEDILKLSKLDENVSLPEKGSVNLYHLSRQVLDSLSAIASKQDVKLFLEGEQAQITGVWQLLHEMVYNLCDNAIKYNRPGGSVTVTVKKLPAAVALTVTDTGIGIPYADQSRIFERFYRVDKSHSQRVGGTGLGLSIVKHGAMLHNARLSLESTPAQGTTVGLEFPLTAEQT